MSVRLQEKTHSKDGKTWKTYSITVPSKVLESLRWKKGDLISVSYSSIDGESGILLRRARPAVVKYRRTER